MSQPLICLTLTGKTLKEDVEIIEKYREYIDVVELRADFLNDDERLVLRKFPAMSSVPCILTIRRRVDGGQFIEGEANRSVLFAKALSFIDQDTSRNFAYVDFEEDFHVSSLQDAATAYGLRIIRSIHDMKNPIANIAQRLERLRGSEFEIPKIAFMPHSLDDVKMVFDETAKLKDSNHIVVAMGPMGTPTRILSAKLKNYLTYASPSETQGNLADLAHLDPIVLKNTYRFSKINEETTLYGITGWPLKKTGSPVLHNAGYEKHDMNSVYVPIRSDSFRDVMEFANVAGVRGLSVTIPHKEAVLDNVDIVEKTALDVGASNTIVRDEHGKWRAYNTDVIGFTKSLLEFLGTKNLAHKKVAIIGAGGASRAIAYSVKNLKGDACIFNRTTKKAQELAELYGFKYARLSSESIELLKKYSDIIIQTTSVGMNSEDSSSEENDPLYFYDFSGKEMLFDIVYVPAVTPVMARASKAGCKVCNGYDMLRYQAYEQFRLFTGVEY
ncbi:MAG: type I 3-dehydroquinate dehydratase [Treponema sp.]|nr:type I 3-dehydroquinate dehydratase [Treponema sp.]